MYTVLEGLSFIRAEPKINSAYITARSFLDDPTVSYPDVPHLHVQSWACFRH